MKYLHLLTKVQAMLLAGLLIMGIGIPADGWADEMFQPGTYATVQVLETTVLFMEAPRQGWDATRKTAPD